MQSCFTPNCRFSSLNKVLINQIRQHIKELSKTWISLLSTQNTYQGAEDCKLVLAARKTLVVGEEEEQKLTMPQLRRQLS